MRNSKKLLKDMKKNYEIYLFIIPTIVYFIVFSYLPMNGAQIAFKDFQPVLGIFDSPWVGLKQFNRFLSSPFFWIIIRNTVSISLYSLVAGFPLPIILAILLSHQPFKRFTKTVQTVSYAPHFISTVVLVGMMKIMLTPSTGIVNFILESIGGKPIFFFARPDLFYDLYVWSGIWQNLGWSAIIYVGVLTNINPELHEAATIDGASIWKRIWHIDIPGILPTIIIMLILRTGSVLSVGFEKAYLMQNSQNASTSEVISTYVYKQGLISAHYISSKVSDISLF